MEPAVDARRQDADARWPLDSSRYADLIAACAYLLRRHAGTSGTGHREERQVLHPARSSGGSATTGPLSGDTGDTPVGSGVATRPVTARDAGPGKVTRVRYRLEVRLTAADVGLRVVIRWRRPGPDGGEQVTDVLGILEEHHADYFTVRTADGQLVAIPSTRALAGKVVPERPRRRHEGPGSS
jgi:hypothetical protein